MPLARSIRLFVASGKRLFRTLGASIREAVLNKVSVLCTEKWPAYRKAADGPTHKITDHMSGLCVVGAVHTQTIKGFWFLSNRGIMGSFHKIIPKYLPLWVAEFLFRNNSRRNPDIFREAVRGC